MSQSKYHTKAPLSYSEKLCTRNLKQIKAVNKAYADAEVLIAITHKNQSSLLNRAVESAINQSLISQHKARIVILDDSSESIHVEELRRISEHPSITLLSAECGSAARARAGAPTQPAGVRLARARARARARGGALPCKRP